MIVYKKGVITLDTGEYSFSGGNRWNGADARTLAFLASEFHSVGPASGEPIPDVVNRAAEFFSVVPTFETETVADTTPPGSLPTIY